MCTVTDHAKSRSKQRLGLNKKSIKGNASKALHSGIAHSESKGNLKKYMDSLYFYNKKATNTRIYNHYVYIFYGETLITVFDLPKNLRHIADDIQRKKKVREANDKTTN